MLWPDLIRGWKQTHLQISASWMIWISLSLICLLILGVINMRASTMELKESESKSAVWAVQNEGWEVGVAPQPRPAPGRAGLVGPAH